MMNQTSLIEIAETLKPGGVYPVELDNQSFWVKVCGEDKNTLLRRLALRASKLPALHYFKLNSPLPASKRFMLEIEAICQMSDAELPVPDLVSINKNFFISKNAGKPVNADTPFADLSTVFLTLARFHRKGFVHGCPAIRDVIISDDRQVTFIDFEETAERFDYKLMARDVFLLMMDLYRLPQLDNQQRLLLLQVWQQTAPQQASACLPTLVALLKKFAWLTRVINKLTDNREARFFEQTLALFSLYLDQQNQD